MTASRAEAERKRKAASVRAIPGIDQNAPAKCLPLASRTCSAARRRNPFCSTPGPPARRAQIRPPKPILVVLHAIGGAGKTALLRRLVDDLSADDFPHADKVIGWSAYSQGSGDNRNADADGFISNALDLIGFAGARPADSVNRARLLAALMQQTRTLLLLDGIEPLQSPPRVNLERLKDKRRAYKVELARTNPGLVVVTSRQPLPETEGIARVRNHPLEELSPPAGAALLKRLGCWGASKDLEAASREADGHALTLTALGGYIEAVEAGDIRRRDDSTGRDHLHRRGNGRSGPHRPRREKGRAGDGGLYRRVRGSGREFQGGGVAERVL
ncbi:MAG: hypothetical protein R3B98_00060 [Hyphomonas sp.]